MTPEDLRREIKRIEDYAGRNGILSAAFRVIEGVGEKRSDKLYNMSMSGGAIPSQEKVTKGPKISVLIPVCDPDPDDFAHLLDSLSAQRYGNFETVIADAGSDSLIGEVTRLYANDREKELNIKYVKLPENLGISGNTNEALKHAEGEFVSLLDHDDFLDPEALYETVKCILAGADVIYTDEDKYDGLRDTYFSPNRKPDFNLDLLLSNNYICHFLTVRRSLFEGCGGLRSEYDGAQDYDLVLRLSEVVQRDKIAHVPRILYHWRATEGSTSVNPGSKLYAYDRGREALQDYFDRRGLAVKVTDTAHRGFYRPDYSGIDVPQDSCRIFIDRRLSAVTPGFEKQLAGFFSRPEVGIVGARIIGKTGRTLSNGLTEDADGKRVPEYGRIDYRFSGYMHRASMIRGTEAVSAHAFAIRRELLSLMDEDPFKMCSMVREKGYLVVTDPGVIFRLKGTK